MKSITEFIQYLSFSSVCLKDECIENMVMVASFIYNVESEYIYESMKHYKSLMGMN